MISVSRPRLSAVLGVLLAAVLVVSPALAQDLLRADASNDWLIRDATVLTVTNGTIQNGDILVRNVTVAHRIGRAHV